MKKHSKQILAGLLCIVLLPLFSTAAHADQYVHPVFHVMVNSGAGEINFRTGAGTNYDTLMQIPNGTVLQITDIAYNMPDQFLFGYTNYAGYSGWVSLRQTLILNGGGYPAIDFYATASADAGSINFHTGAGLYTPVITDLWNGTQFHITDLVYNAGDGFFWGYTSYGGSYGWVSIRQTNVRRDYGTTPSYTVPQPQQPTAPQPPQQPQPTAPQPQNPEPQPTAPQPQNSEPQDPSQGVYRLYNYDDPSLIEHSSEDGYYIDNYLDIGERVSFMQISEGQPGDYLNGSDWPHRAVITGYDSDGTVLWEVKTEPVYSLNGGYEALGSSEQAFYYSDRKNIYALDLDTGDLLWTNEDAEKLGATDGGFHGKAVGNEGELYVCATNGGGFLAIDATGRTLTVRGGQMPANLFIQDIVYDGKISTVFLENSDGETAQMPVQR